MTDNGNDDGTLAPDFNAASTETPEAEQQTSFPTPQELNDAGIKHDSVYDAWSAQGPDEYNHDMPSPPGVDGLSANEQAHADHVDMVEGFRRAFHEEFTQHREHFNERAQPGPEKE